MTDDLVTWLREQIAETERVAQAAIDQLADHGENMHGGWSLWGEFGQLINYLASPRNALAQCEAYTLLLDSIAARLADAARLEQMGAQPADVSVIRAPAEWQLAVLARAYQHRDGYRSEWKP